MKVTLHYVAYLRETAGCAEETRTTAATTLAALYDEAAADHGFCWPRTTMAVAVNERVVPWTSPVRDGDEVLFLPPAAGG